MPNDWHYQDTMARINNLVSHFNAAMKRVSQLERDGNDIKERCASLEAMAAIERDWDYY